MSGGTPDRPGQPAPLRRAADAIQALSALSAYAHWRDRDPGAVPMLEVDEHAAQRVVNQVLAADPAGRELTEAETAELLGAYGITMVPRFPGRQPRRGDRQVAERLGWNVVLKATAKAVRGRPDLASVHRNIDDAGGDGRRLAAISAGWSATSACRVDDAADRGGARWSRRWPRPGSPW